MDPLDQLATMLGSEASQGGEGDVIAIDSDDDDGNEQNVEVESNAAAAAALAAEPVRDYLVCQLLVPPSAGLRPQPAGAVYLWLEGESSDKFDLLLCKYPDGAKEDTICIPVESVSSAEVEAAGPTVMLEMSPPLVAVGFLEDIMGELGAPATPEGYIFSTMAIATAPAGVRAMLATLKAWLPSITLHGPRSLGLTEPIALRLRGISLVGRDVSLLEEDRWINDTVLDFFLSLVVEVVVPDELRGSLHVAKTQFFTRLQACSAASGEKGWENVKTWTRSISGGIAGQRYIVYPVNEENCHWWVVVVCHPQRAMELGGMPAVTTEESRDIPRIVCLDPSCEPSPKDDPVGLLKGYLRRELFSKPAECENSSVQNDMMAQVSRWKAAVHGLEKMGATVPDAPRQENVFDCGVFVLEYLIHLLRHPVAFSKLGMESHQGWFDQSLVTHRRQRLRDIIAKLQSEAQSSGEGDVAVLLRDERVQAAVFEALTDEPMYDNGTPRTTAPKPAEEQAPPVSASSSLQEGILAAMKFLSQGPPSDDEEEKEEEQEGSDDLHRQKRQRFD